MGERLKYFIFLVITLIVNVGDYYISFILIAHKVNLYIANKYLDMPIVIRFTNFIYF
jgi:hypothetical protein